MGYPPFTRFRHPLLSDWDSDLTSSSEEIVAYFPHHVTARVTAQRGLFTWHRIPGRAYQPKALIKWVIPSCICLDLKLVLNKAGINQASMFPDVGAHRRLCRMATQVGPVRLLARITLRQTVSKPSAAGLSLVRQLLASLTWFLPLRSIYADATQIIQREPSSAKGGQQPRHLDKVQHPPEIVRQDRQTALRPYLLQASHEEIARVPPPFHRPKRMLHHCLRCFITSGRLRTRCSISSNRCSSTHRVRRRPPLLRVHCGLSGQALQADVA